MRSTLQINRYILAGIFCILLFACNKTNRFYDQLEATPELKLDNNLMYRSAYKLGDTIMIYGRLKGPLQVQIGNATPMQMQAQQVTLYASTNPVTYDLVKVLITADMGIGADRAVKITGGGITVYGPPIEIYENEANALTDSLKLTPYADLAPDAVVFYCRDGRGSIYMYANGSMQLLQNGQTQTLLSVYADQQGAFSIITMYSGGVDRANKFLYFSALTEDGQAGHADNHVFRFCRLNLQTRQITTMNRTLIPKNGNFISEATYLPWEGDIAQVKVMAAKDIYPAEDGTVYMTLMDPLYLADDTTVNQFPYPPSSFYALVHMDPAGKVNYVYNKPDNNSAPWKVVMEPPYYLYTDAIFTYPGAPFRNINSVGLISVAPDEKLMYLLPIFFGSAQGINQYDLNTRVLLYEYRKERLLNTEPQFVGPFSALKNGFYFYGNYDPMQGFGFMPLPNERLLILFYSTWWSTLDFSKKRGDMYAPSTFDMSNYEIRPNDVLLNYDAAGQLYMTANDKTVLVKTAPR